MSKVLKTVGAIAGVVAAVAVPVFGAAAIVGQIAAGVAVAASIGAAATAPRPRQPAIQGSITNITIGADQATPMMIGNVYCGGALVHQAGYGAAIDSVPNPYLGLAVVYSAGGPIAGIDSYWSDFAQLGYSGGSTAGAASGYFNGFLYWRSQSGATPEAAALSPQWGGLPGWGSAYKLSGYAAALWSLKWDSKEGKFTSGVPRIGIQGRGVLTWDPRQDSTWPGGSGPHRWVDPRANPAGFAAAKATWSYSERPGLHALRYALGTWERSPAAASADPWILTYGVGIPVDGLVVADFVELENVCAANGWTVAGVLLEPGDKWENLKRILAAGGAEPCFKGGRLGLKITAPRVALDTIGRDDIADGTIEAAGAQPREDRINTVVPKFRSPAHKWELQQSDEIVISNYLAADKEEKRREEAFEFVTNATQAAQLATYRLFDSREQGPITLRCKPRLRRYAGGDMLTLTDDLRDDLGLAQNNVVVLRRAIDPVTMVVTLTLVTENQLKHIAALSVTGTAPATITLPTTQQIDRNSGVNDVLGQIELLAEDGVLTRFEKITKLIPLSAQLDDRWNLLNVQADALASFPHVVAAKAAASSAYSAWLSYRNGLSPAWNNVGADTMVVRADFNGRVNTLAAALETLAGAIGQATTWVSIAGPGKPADNATVGAPPGTPVGDVPSETVADAVKDMSGNVVPVRDQIAAAQQALEQSIAQAQEDIAAAELAAQSAQATAQAIESSVVGLVTTTIPDLTQRITSAEGTITSQGTTLTTYDTRITNVTNQASTTAGSLAVLTQTVQAGNPNLLPNGGFENGLANWALTPGNYAGTWGVTSSAAVYGRHAFAFATANNQTLFLSSEPIPVNAGLQYAASARMRVRGTSGRAVMDVLWFDANHQLIPAPNSSMIGGKLTAPTEFGAVSRAGSSAVTGTAPAGAAWARIRLIGENLSSGDQVAFQQVKFEIGSAPTAYTSEASIQQAFTVISTATEQVAQLGTTVGTQGSTITRLDSATTTLQGDMALVQTRLVAGSPNLLGNGGFEDGLRAWVSEIGNWGAVSGNVWGNYAGWDGVAAQTTGERAVVLTHAPVLFDPGQEFTFTTDANAYNTANTAYCRLEVSFFTNQAMTQQIGPVYGGSAITQPQFSHPPGQDRKRLAVSGVSPSHSAPLWARCRIIFGNMTPIGGCGAAVRQAKFERSPAPTAYSNETSLRQSYQAISTLDGQRASMQTELNTAGTNITNLQSATSTLQGDVATVTQRLVAGSPNLLPNGGFENGMTSWRPLIGSWINNLPLTDAWGAYVYWTGSGATTDGERVVILDSLPFPMEGNAPYVLSADANIWNTQGNAYCRLEALFYSDAAATNQIGQHWGPNVTQPSFWSNPGVNRQNLALFGTTPNGTQRCIVRLLGAGMYNGSNSGTAFRQIKFERGQRLTPYSSEASIHQSAQALSTATQQLSQLSQTVSTQGATVTQTATALTQLEGRVGGVESQYANLNSTVSSQGVTISNSATAITTLNGQMSTVFGQWVLNLDVNGRVAGIRLANNGQYSGLTFRSDLVVFENPNGGFRTVYANGGWKTYNAANIPVYEDGIY